MSAGATASAGTGPRRRVIHRPALTVAMLALAVAVWVLDQLTKQWALGRFTPGEAEPFLGRLLQFTLVFNPGAAFSLGTAFTPVITCIMAAVALGLLVASTRVGSRWWAMAAGFLLGGALGNLTDRLVRPPGFAHGHVVDFLMLPNFPVFNVADSFITTAAVCIFVAAVKDIPFTGRPVREHGEDDASGEVVASPTTTTEPATTEPATTEPAASGPAAPARTSRTSPTGEVTPTPTRPATNEERDRG